MAKFKDIIITDLGQHALNEAITGHTKITFTKAVLASNDLASKTVQDVKAITTLDNQKETSVALLSSQNGAIVLSVTYDNDGLTKDIIFSSVGWYAMTDSTEFLFAVSRYSQPQYLTAVPPDTDETQSITLQVSLAVGQGNVQVVQTQAGVAMKADLSRAIKDWDNSIQQLTDIKADKSQVASDLAKKADQSSVDASVKSINDVLATKANSSDVSDELALKANQSDLEKTNAEVAKKANSDDVKAQIDGVSRSISDVSDTVNANKDATDQALATKADKTDVTAQFATKADKTTIEQELAVKANSADVYTKKQVDDALSSRDTAIATKADKATVDSEISKIDFTPYAKTADVNKQIKTVTDLANSKVSADYSYSKAELDKKLLALSTDTSGKVNATQVASMIAGKADKTYVDNQIASIDFGKIKFRKQYINSDGQTADKTWSATKNQDGTYTIDLQHDDWTASKLSGVLAQLPNKADTSTVNAQIADAKNTIKSSVDNLHNDLQNQINANDKGTITTGYDWNTGTPTNESRSLQNAWIVDQAALRGAVNRMNDINSNANGRLSLGGGNMNLRSTINWNGGNIDDKTGNLGGLNWAGGTDWAKIYGDQDAYDNLDLAIDLGDDGSNHVSFRKNGSETSAITSDGHFTGTVDWGHVNGRPQDQVDRVNTITPLFREIQNSNNWNDIFGVTNPNNVLTSLRINAGGTGSLLNNYAAGIGFGGADTKGVLSVAYGDHQARITGGNGGSPVWSEDIAWKSDVTNLQNQINNKANASDLSNYATASDLAGYAKSTDVASKAQITDLQNQISELKDSSFEVQTFKDEASGKAWEAQKAGHRLAIIQS